MISMCACGGVNCPHCNPNLWTHPQQNTLVIMPSFSQREEELKARIAELEKELALCAPFLKENETPAMCIARNRTDVDIALGLYADEVKKREALEAENQRLREGLAGLSRGLGVKKQWAIKALLGGGEK